MKLIEAHIENFGKLSGENFKFNSHLNEFYKENGWGKSTLAAFIKVMLFGFENERARDELSNERKRYKPWQGGVYGGSLEIQVKDKNYIISRTFGAKDKEDEFVLRDASTLLLSDDFTKNIGEELFEIDLAAFSRTIFISQNDIYTEATGNINAKIGNLTDNTDDINNFEAVDKKLTDLLNSMSPTRKTGSISKLIDELNDLRVEVKKASTLDEAIDKYVKAKEEEKNKYFALKEKQQKLIEKKKEVSKYKDLKNIQKEYEGLLETVTNLKNKLLAIKGQLPQKEIDSKVVEEALKNIDELKKWQSYKEAYNISEDKLSEYKTLDDIFTDRPIEQEIFEDKISKAEELIQLEKNAEATKVTEEELEEYKKLKESLGENKVDEHTIELKVSNWTKKNEIKSAIKIKELNYQTQKASIDKELEAATRTAKKNYVPLILGFISLIAGFALLPVNVYFTIGLVAVALGSIGSFVAINNKNKSKAEALRKNYEDSYRLLEEMKEEIDLDNSFIEKNEREMNAFLKLFNIAYVEDEVINQLFNIKHSVSRYKQLLKKVENVDKSAVTTIDKYKSELTELIREFEPDFKAVDSYKYRQTLIELKNKYTLYIEYKEQLEKYNKCVEEGNRLQDSVDSFFKEYEIEKAEDITKQLLDLKINVRSYQDIFVEYDQAKQNLSKFVEKNNITDDIINLKVEEKEENLLDLDKEAEEIIREIEVVNSTITNYNNSLNELREKRDIISEKEECLEQLEQSVAADKKKYKLIKKTKELLEASKNSLTARYMKPILDSFKKYYNIISEDITDKFSIDAKINITANEGGIPRRIDLLSEGTKDLVYICMRLALVDAMYTEEKPFILFDDPFVNFDDEKVAGSLKLLQEVSKEYQIIYFTCHNSRK